MNTVSDLTRQEHRVLKLVARGWRNSKIAEELVISPRTVETHRQSLMKKLDIKNQFDLVRFAIRQGILPLDS